MRPDSIKEKKQKYSTYCPKCGQSIGSTKEYQDHFYLEHSY